MNEEAGLRRRLRRLFGSHPTTLLLVGSLLLLLIAAYVASAIALRPDTQGRELRYDQLFGILQQDNRKDPTQQRIRDLTILSADGVAVGSIDGQPFWVGIGTRDQVVGAVVQQLAGMSPPPRFRIDPQALKQALHDASSFALPAATLTAGFVFVFLVVRGMGSDVGQLGRSKARRYASALQTGVTFADVAGTGETVDELREVVEALTAPERLTVLGAEAPRGVLLVGPPGCGKTLLARAVAGEAGVPFFSLSASEFTESLVGVGAARVRDLFKRARSAAPAIIFIDELDAIGRSRSTGGGFNAEWEATLNELLVQLDGFDRTDRVVLIAATNRPDILDTALLRKGRFDRQIVVDVPDRAGRMAIFAVHCRGKPLADNISWESLLGRTVGFTGADIAATMNEAAILASRLQLSLIGEEQLSQAIERVVAGPERRSRIPNADEKRRTAYHESGHAIVGWLRGASIEVDKVSLVARGHGLGSTWNSASEDRCLITRSQLIDDIAFCLAGRAAEHLVFGETSSASQADLGRANAAAAKLVREYGMSEVLGAMVLNTEGQSSDHSSEFRKRADDDVLRVLTEADAAALSVLRPRRALLDNLADQLMANETLDHAQLEAILGTVDHDQPNPVLKPGEPAADGPN
ncbi:MAG: AAA family ATPase [Actinomycetota bacterium]|nr:AAA family ATPase [Actinomycetota bacterium]